MKESWRMIPSFPDYAVSTHGRVRRISPGKRTHCGFILKPRLKNGYLRIELRLNNKPRAVFVHRLVLEAFKGPLPIGCCVDHIDFIRTNNKLKNLRYVTPRTNTHHSQQAGRLVHGERVWTNKLSEEDVKQILRTPKTRHSGIDLARRFHVTKECISAIRLRKNWKHISI